MNFSRYIAKRYLFSPSSNNAINIITGFAALGIVVGTMALFIVLSGFSGLREFSLQFTSIFDCDIKVFPENGKTITLTEAQKKQLDTLKGVEAYSSVIEERVFLQHKDLNHIAFIKGVDDYYGIVNPIDSIVDYGEWLNPTESEVVIGYGIVSKLSLNIRDYNDLLKITVPKPGKGQKLDPTTAFKNDVAVVSGVYHVNEEINSKYVFSDIKFARQLLSLDNSKVSALEIKLTKNAKEEEIEEAIKASISEILHNEVVIKNRIQQNDALYKMLNTEHIAVYLITTLLVIICFFNVIGAIIMMILDKHSNIKTLYNIGATTKKIRKIFFWQGTLMTIIGATVGLLLGILLVVIQKQFNFVYITADLPYPVMFTIKNVLIVLATVLTLGIVASKIATSRVRVRMLQ